MVRYAVIAVQKDQPPWDAVKSGQGDQDIGLLVAVPISVHDHLEWTDVTDHILWARYRDLIADELEKSEHLASITCASCCEPVRQHSVTELPEGMIPGPVPSYQLPG
jgi:hypothetical protein